MNRSTSAFLRTVRIHQFGIHKPLTIAFLTGACLFGCAPEPAAPPSTSESQEEGPPPEPVAKPFTVLAKFAESELLQFKGLVAECVPPGSGWRLEWVGPDETGGDWDLAILQSQFSSEVEDHASELREILDEIYPLHKVDFFVPAGEPIEDGSLKILPITLAPDFVFIRNSLEWGSSPSPEAFRSYVDAGGKIGLPAGEPGAWYRENLNVPSGQVVEVGAGPVGNPYVEGVVKVAIHHRGWLVDLGIPGSEIHSLVDIGLAERVPDWGYRIAVSSGCKDFSLAKEILKALLVTKHEVVVGLGGRAFPVRKSVYQSPRMQGALITAPRQVFDRTLENLLMRPILSK